MGNKIVSLLKLTLIVWLGILIPLVICFLFLRASVKTDTFKSVDTFIENENVNLAKYVELQFSNTYHDMQKLGAYINNYGSKDAKGIQKCIEDFLKNYKSVNYINVYDKTGKIIVGSRKQKDEPSLDKDELNCKINEINYSLVENRDKSISLILLSAQEKQKDKEKRFIKMSVKWGAYDKYIERVTEGSFPRMFYIISPACKRYVSCNSLPKKKVAPNEIAALGLHLAGKIQSILKGLSTVTIASMDFRIVKNEVMIPNTLHGPKFFLVTAMDDAALQEVSDSLLRKLPIMLGIIISIILLISIVIARLYERKRGDLDVANKISDSTPLAIVIFRVDNGQIQKINLTARTLLRVQEESIPTINMWKFFISEADREYVKNAIDSDINVFNYEVLGQTFGGGTFWAVCSVSPVVIDEVKYIVLGVLDINRRKEVEKKLANNAEMLEKQIAERTADLEKNALELQTANAELEKAKIAADTANNAKSTFLTNVSNELKTPINAIIGYSEILQEEAEDRKDNVTADDLRKIIGAARHLLSLINEILDLSQIEAGKVQLFFENFAVESLMKDVESVIMPMVAENNNSFYMEHSKDIGTMYTDATKVRQCLMNVLSNAAKFTEFGKITLRVSTSIRGGEDFIEFSVVDTGRGIPQERLATIFDSFQGDDSNGSGTGLGLAVTKEYVGYMGGTIEVESEVGVGSKFVIKLPRICKTESGDKVTVKSNDNAVEIEDFIESTEESIKEIKKEEKELQNLENEVEKEMKDDLEEDEV